jgi:NAD(P)-dependent dehydrogenase (short-subunit alcohol dehydrogenase family)
MEIAGKVAIVTGSGGRGSGRAIAQRLAYEGASVVISDINEQGGLETVCSIQAKGGRARFFLGDVGHESEVRSLITFAEDAYGGLDILVNNASAPYHPEAPLEHWFETVQVDLMGAMYGTRHGIEAMLRRGGGAIINIGSTSALAHGRDHTGGAPGYDVAKSGVIRLTTMLAWLGEQKGIRVNCLVPDWVATPEVKSYVESLTPTGRRDAKVPDVLTTLDEVASATAHLVMNDQLAGRVMVFWSGKPPGLIPFGDAGYAAIETLTF